MALFDQFGFGSQGAQGANINSNLVQANPGMAVPNPQQAQGSPNFQIGNWGNTPNYAGNLQQIMQGTQTPQGLMQFLMSMQGKGQQPNPMQNMAPRNFQWNMTDQATPAQTQNFQNPYFGR